MTLNLIGADGQSESMLNVKLWPVISLIVACLIGLAVYSAHTFSNHEARLAVTEKTTGDYIESSKAELNSVKNQLQEIARDQELYYSLREPRWKEWKAWNERKVKNGNGK